MVSKKWCLLHAFEHTAWEFILFYWYATKILFDMWSQSMRDRLSAFCVFRCVHQRMKKETNFFQKRKKKRISNENVIRIVPAAVFFYLQQITNHLINWNFRENYFLLLLRIIWIDSQ